MWFARMWLRRERANALEIKMLSVLIIVLAIVIGSLLLYGQTPVENDDHDILPFLTIEEMMFGGRRKFNISNVTRGNVSFAGMTDIQLLFHIFDNPLHTVEAFGFPYHEEFVKVRSNATKLWNGNYLSILWNADSRVKVMHIRRFRWTFHERSTINWDALSQLKELEYFSVDDFGITGVVSFHKLPEKLYSLLLTRNLLSGVEKAGDCPDSLWILDLSGNPLDESPPSWRDQLPKRIIYGES